MNKYLIISLIIIFSILIWIQIQRKNNSPKIYYRKKLIGGYNARTIPPIGIFIKESERNNKALLDHEMIHWKQFQRDGLGFILGYAKNQITKGYDQNPYEVEARVNESEHCQKNYTECVRSGEAKTIFNPDFRKT